VALECSPVGSDVPHIALSDNCENQARAKLFAEALEEQGFKVRLMWACAPMMPIVSSERTP